MLYTLCFFENDFWLIIPAWRPIAPGSTKTINENRTAVDRQEDKFFFCTFRGFTNDFALRQYCCHPTVNEDFESRGRKCAKRRFFQAFVLETKEPHSCKQ